MKDPTKKELSPAEQAIEMRAKEHGITRAAAAAQIAHEQRLATAAAAPPPEVAPEEPPAGDSPAKLPRRPRGKAS